MRWLRRLWHKSLTERRLDSELQCHLEQQIADYVASGLPPCEARRRASSNLEASNASRKSAAKPTGKITWKFLPVTFASPFEASQGIAASRLSPFSRWPLGSAHPRRFLAWWTTSRTTLSSRPARAICSWAATSFLQAPSSSLALPPSSGAPSRPPTISLALLLFSSCVTPPGLASSIPILP